ncbi:zonular occludens toxin domain-containing protein [Pseudoalteromonas sp. T1lg48]|uniref:zonular occludens toxin domain-containing protein n=1 Tax=Pseudoalteromonas sp. T1lg48 TaxID=2077100 RepID=UPI000CF5EB30|nr:zonular occludens toxin domain-containing protein [Pseudoalteromonas sp. T1lg48]
MSCWFIEGRRGGGKSKYAVRMIRGRLRNGRAVATNLNLNLDKLVPGGKTPVIRLPDRPRSEDFLALGKAYPELDPDKPETYDESKFGLVVVDEMLVSFNSRGWKDKDRQACVDWFVQSRKFGWHLVFIGQDVEAVDKQLRQALITEIYSCRASTAIFGRGMANTIIQLLAKLFTLGKGIPKFHVCRFYDGQQLKRKSDGVEYFRLNELHSCYQTGQQFNLDLVVNKKGDLVDMRSIYSVLPDSYLYPWYHATGDKPVSETTEQLPQREQPKEKIIQPWHYVVGAISAVFLYFGLGSDDPEAAEQVATATTQTSTLNTVASALVPNSTQAATSVEPEIYITCSVQNINTGVFDYCFEKNGKPFHPNDAGFAINQIKACSAQLIDPFDNTKINVTCNPYRVPSFTYDRTAAPQDADS